MLDWPFFPNVDQNLHMWKQLGIVQITSRASQWQQAKTTTLFSEFFLSNYKLIPWCSLPWDNCSSILSTVFTMPLNSIRPEVSFLWTCENICWYELMQFAVVGSSLCLLADSQKTKLAFSITNVRMWCLNDQISYSLRALVYLKLFRTLHWAENKQFLWTFLND